MLNLSPFDNLVLVVAMSNFFFTYYIIGFTYRLYFAFFYYQSWELLSFEYSFQKPRTGGSLWIFCQETMDIFETRRFFDSAKILK